MKIRLDQLLISKGFFPSREKAKSAIMAGEVLIDGLVFDKAGMPVPEDAEISIKNSSCPYVSRGGLKLEKAISEFDIDLTDRICMDIGASTGGFTDCMLKSGAKKVYAFDVGYGQLDYRLREDPRVVNIERCNFRYFDNEDEAGNAIVNFATFATIDVSFISLRHIFPVVSKLLEDSPVDIDIDKDKDRNNQVYSSVVALIKPQFEAGREKVGKHGLVKDPKTHIEVIENTIDFARESDLYPIGLSFSPITGAKGNIEYLIYLNKGSDLGYNIIGIVDAVVKSAHDLLAN